MQGYSFVPQMLIEYLIHAHLGVSSLDKIDENLWSWPLGRGKGAG